MSSSLLGVITGREELIECSKLKCIAKRILGMVPGQEDQRSMSAVVRHRRRTCEVKSELGKGKIG